MASDLPLNVAVAASRPRALLTSLQALGTWLQPYTVILRFLALALILMSCSRVGLIYWQWDRVAAAGAIGHMLLQGIRSDLITIGLCTVPVALLLPLACLQRRFDWWQHVSRYWFTLCLIVITFLELATPQFLLEYDTRPGAMLVQYIMYPTEVGSMLWEGYRGALFGTTAALGLIGWGIVRSLREVRSNPPVSTLRVALLWPVLVVLTGLMIRSSVQHRPANLASFLFCEDAMVNSLVANSMFTVLSAVHAMQGQGRSSEIYGRMPHDELVRRARLDTGVAFKEFRSEELPTLHRQVASVQRAKPLNLVIVLEESLGAGFIKSLGGEPVAPNFDRLATEGIWFERLYATGTRSIRGIEAVIAGFPPTPSLSVVKLPNSQSDFATLASLLGRQGYRSEFVYGGASHFDNMRGFFLGNGFNAVVDQRDFVNPKFVGSWGASDEDLFAMADKRIEALHQEQRSSASTPNHRNFFLLVFSSSNHSPFEYPDGRIEQYDAEKQTVNNAVRYADHALGQFIDQARTRDYWKDTLFLVVADHDTRVHGSTLVPVNKFHIPGLILGADVTPLKVSSIASQIDLAPTVMSLMGVNSEHPLPGRDLTRTLPEFGNIDGPAPRAIMQYEQSYARLQGEILTVLLPNAEVRDFTYLHATRQLKPIVLNNQELHRQALASALLPAWLYKERRYRVNPTSNAGRAEY